MPVNRVRVWDSVLKRQIERTAEGLEAAKAFLFFFFFFYYYYYPCEHWVHLRTNPIESTFATVRHRTKVTNGPGRGRRAW
jgi:hypothetical protein